MIIKRASGKWRVQVKHKGLVVADRSFDRRTDAVRWEAEQKRLLQTGGFVSPSSGRLSVEDLSAEYLSYRRDRISVRAWESDEVVLRIHVIPAVGRMPVGAITPIDLNKLLGEVAKRRSVGTVTKVRTVLRGLFLYAEETRKISASPARDLAIPRPDSGANSVADVNPFTLKELRDVVSDQRQISQKSRVSQYAQRYADVTLILGLTGLRMGELRGLRVRDVVDSPYPALLVRRSCPQSARTGAIIERVTTKGRRARLVPLVAEAQAVVDGWSPGRGPDELLFPSPEGAYLRASNWRRTVHWDNTCRGRRPHDLRHTAATLWLRAGVDVKTVAAWLGHASTKLTLDTYGHWMGTDADRAAIRRLEGAFAELGGDVPGTSRLPGVDGLDLCVDLKGGKRAL